MLLGNNIKFIRKKMKLSQEEFGAMFNVTRTTIGYYENEKAQPSVEFFLKLENISGYSFTQICTGNLYLDVQKSGKAGQVTSMVNEDRPPYGLSIEERLKDVEDFLKEKFDFKNSK